MKQTRRRFLLTALGSGIGLTAGAGLTLSQAMAATSAAKQEVQQASADCSPLLDHALRPLMGAEKVRLCDTYADKVLLIVNTASKCGFVDQFEGLEALHERYEDQGLAVLGFPSSDFRQEYADEAAVAEFCKLNYGVTFPMFQKVHVRGNEAHPLYAELAAEAGGEPSWNFNKYLVDRSGKVQKLYGASDEPLGAEITGAIEQLL